jgi:hypothetical protein
MRWKVRRAAIPPDVRNKFEQFGERVLAHAWGGGQLSAAWPELDPLLRNEQHRAYLGPWLMEMRDRAERRETIILFAAVAAAIIALAAGVLAFLAWRFPVN